MTYFLRKGNTFRPASEKSLDLHDQLPVGTYTLKQDTFGNFFFEIIENFSFNSKRYGDNIKNTDRIINTFLSREQSTGVMLAGEKGSGKSLLAKTIAIKAHELGIPTLVINEPWAGESFNQLIQSINQPCVVLFDEFEKVYDRNDQEKILTLLDGVYPSKKLFVLTCNDKYRVDHHMRNRPGRIFYMIDFKGLSSEFITEYCQDNLENKTHIETICKLSSLFGEFNFDMLKALIEEMNRYNESPQEAMTILNAKPEFESENKFSVSLEVDNNRITESNRLSPPNWHGNPLVESISVDYDLDPNDDDSPWIETLFRHEHLKEINPSLGVFVYVNEKNEKTRQVSKHFNYFDAF